MHLVASPDSDRDESISALIGHAQVWQAFLHVLSLIEAKTGTPAPDCWQLPKRHQGIHAALRALGHQASASPTPEADFPRALPHGWEWGVVYVLDGASHGNRLLVAHAQRFDIDISGLLAGTSPWPSCCARLDAELQAAPHLEAAVEAATWCFRTMHQLIVARAETAQ